MSKCLNRRPISTFSPTHIDCTLLRETTNPFVGGDYGHCWFDSVGESRRVIPPTVVRNRDWRYGEFGIDLASETASSSRSLFFRKKNSPLGKIVVVGKCRRQGGQILAGLRACGEQIIRERLCRCLRGRRAQRREIIENQ